MWGQVATPRQLSQQILPRATFGQCDCLSRSDCCGKVLSMGGLRTTGIYFSQFQMLEVRDQEPAWQVLGRAPFWV